MTGTRRGIRNVTSILGSVTPFEDYRFGSIIAFLELWRKAEAQRSFGWQQKPSFWSRLLRENCMLISLVARRTQEIDDWG